MTIKTVDLSKVKFTTELATRFWSNVSCDDLNGGGCWEWRGHIQRKGYGSFTMIVDGLRRTIAAHRIAVAFERLELMLLPGMVCDHLCRNRKCVRPSHIRVVQQADNIHADGSLCITKRKAEQETCERGHELVWVNARERPSGKRRRCMICHAENQRRYAARKKVNQ